ncbi:MAG: response regulator [Promethearchaeota archaeon]
MGQKGRTPTILIVDDEKEVIVHVEKVLKLEGFQTISCTNEKDALGILEKKSDEIILVLLDLLMPGISGFEILKRVKNSNNLRHIRIIIFTAKYIR